MGINNTILTGIILGIIIIGGGATFYIFSDINNFAEIQEIVINNSFETINESDCINFDINGSCNKWSHYNLTTDKQSKKGYIINYTNKKIIYNLLYDCCQYYNESPYREYKGYSIISCTLKINNICNPKIQQTSTNPRYYDSTGRIFVIKKDGIEPHLVGANRWFIDNDIYIGKITEINNSIQAEAQT